MRNNVDIRVNFEYCFLLDVIPAENWFNAVNYIVITYLINNLPTNYYTDSFKNRIETRIIENKIY